MKLVQFLFVALLITPVASTPADDNSLSKQWEDGLAQVYEALPRGHKLMKEFDAQLDSAVARGEADFNIFANPSYVKLLLLRGYIEQVEDQMVDAYNRALRSSDRGAIVEIDQMLNRADDLQRFALSRILTRLKANPSLNFSLSDRSYKSVLPLIENQADQLKDTTFLAMQLSYGERLAQYSEDVERSTFKNITGSAYAEKKWVLTFDDGPHKTVSDKVRKVLKDNQAKAVFFALSKNVKTYPAIAKNIFGAGHVIGSHSIDHADLSKLSAANIKNQVVGSRDAIEKTLKDEGASGAKVKYFRCPYGAGIFPPKSQNVMNAIADAGMTHVLWNVDSLDWQDKDAESVKNRVVKQMKSQKRGIILFHDIQAATPLTVSKLFASDYVTTNGITFTSAL